jgi:hypothetical protein
MAGKPPDARPEGGDEHSPRGQQEEAERIGPLTLARHVKDDGRALILYTREPREGR